MIRDLNEKMSKLAYIETEHFCLRQLTVSDATDYFSVASDPRTSAYLLWEPHTDIDYTKRYLKRICELYEKKEFFDYAAVLKSENKVIGTGGYSSIDTPNHAAEIGYVLHPDYWGKGYATELAKELISFGFDELGLNRIYARYMDGNTASRRVMDHCRMKYEGTFRQLLYVKGQYRDIAVCSILREEYYHDHQSKEHCAKFSSHWYDRLR